MKWKLGNLAGIGIYIHWSFWLLPAWLLFSSAGGVATGLTTVGLVFAVFGCVVLHELGHALMARRYGVGTHDITLYPIGGVARLERMPTKPSQELAIALAGPAVNVVIAGALFAGILLAGLSFQISPLNLVGGSFLVSLLWINVLLVVFNLLAGLSDGWRTRAARFPGHANFLFVRNHDCRPCWTRSRNRSGNRRSHVGRHSDARGSVRIPGSPSRAFDGAHAHRGLANTSPFDARINRFQCEPSSPPPNRRRHRLGERGTLTHGRQPVQPSGHLLSPTEPVVERVSHLEFLT